jgi:hypothetical protein
MLHEACGFGRSSGVIKHGWKIHRVFLAIQLEMRFGDDKIAM